MQLPTSLDLVPVSGCPRCEGSLIHEHGEAFCLMCGWRPSQAVSAYIDLTEHRPGPQLPVRRGPGRPPKHAQGERPHIPAKRQLEKRACAFCGEPYQPWREDSEYCSPSCSTKGGWRKRKAKGA